MLSVEWNRSVLNNTGGEISSESVFTVFMKRFRESRICQTVEFRFDFDSSFCFGKLWNSLPQSFHLTPSMIYRSCMKTFLFDSAYRHFLPSPLGRDTVRPPLFRDATMYEGHHINASCCRNRRHEGVRDPMYELYNSFNTLLINYLVQKGSCPGMDFDDETLLPKRRDGAFNVIHGNIKTRLFTVYIVE